MNLHGPPAVVYGDVSPAAALSRTRYRGAAPPAVAVVPLDYYTEISTLIPRRTSGNAPSTLSFPKSKSSLWDPSPSGDAVGLQLCYYR